MFSGPKVEFVLKEKKKIKHYRNESLHLQDPVTKMAGVKFFMPEEKKEVKENGCFAFLRCKK